MTLSCNACDWTGEASEACWLGSVGPLCPKCRETTEPVPITFVWLTTHPNPRHPGTGHDAGQRGWKVHAVPMAREDDIVKGEAKRRRSLCGIWPRHGWGRDLFIEEQCSRCERAMQKREAAGEEFADLSEILAAERKAHLCPDCGRDTRTVKECDDDMCPHYKGAKP